MQEQRDSYKEQVLFLETILTSEQIDLFQQKFQHKMSQDRLFADQENQLDPQSSERRELNRTRIDQKSGMSKSNTQNLEEIAQEDRGDKSTKKSSCLIEENNGPKNDQEFEDELDNVLSQEGYHKDV